MMQTKKVISQIIAIVLLIGIVALGTWGVYTGMGEFDKPVQLQSDSTSHSFEINGQRFYVRGDGIYDANSALFVSFVDESTSKIGPNSPTLKEIYGIEEKPNDEFSIFGASRDDVQRLYIQSVLKSINSGRTIHVSRWVTSGDWTQDDDEITITIP